MAKSKDQVEIESDFLDYDSVELLDEDFNDIVVINRLSDSAADKIIFTVFMVNVGLTSFLIGYTPKSFYLWHTFNSIILISYRWYTYKKNRWHYFLFDFCYFTNLLVLIYLWFPWTPPSGMFPVIFVFANGPLLWAVLLWRNSLVPHSVDKMTSLFIHLSPAFTTWGLRWFSTPEQNFVLCSDQTELGPGGCDHVSWKELILWPGVYYLIWLISYVLIVVIWREKRVIERDYATSLRWMTERAKKGFMYKLLSMFGAKYRRVLYFTWQSLFTFLSVVNSYFNYHWKEYNMALCVIIVVIACYNGACFYIDVIGHKYYIEKTKNKT